MKIFLYYKFVYLSTFLLFCYLFAKVSASNILAIFPIAAKSHFSCNKAVVDSLYKAGHNITLVSPFAEQLKSMNNYTMIDSKNKTFIYINQSPIDQFTKLGIRESLDFAMEIGEKYCYDVIHLKEIQNILDSSIKQFDAMFVEILPMFECFSFIAKKLDIPVIAVTTLRSSGFASKEFDSIDNPSYIPYILSSFGLRMNFYERFLNLWYYIQIRNYEYFEIVPKLEKFRRTYFHDIKHHDEYLSLVFQNNHFSYLPIPYFPNAIEIGGIHVQKVKPLPSNFQLFLDEAKHGCILFSLGSIVKSSTITSELMSIIKESFAEIPQRVIWKYEEQLDNLSSNVLIADWIPQRDILGHKNIKAFISHCGQSSTYEAIYIGVPVVATPLFGDQKSNAAVLRDLGVAVYLDVFSMTKEDFRNALHSIINDTKYFDEMKKLSTIFKDRPMSPEETVVYWTEYVIRHNGAPHLKPSAINMALYQYLLLDVILFVFMTVIIGIYILYYILKLILRNCKKYLSNHEKSD